MSVPTYTVEMLQTGSTWFDLTSYVTSVNISRGRSRELDKFEAGSFTVSMNNNTRAFDPTYTSSPFYGHIVPRKQFRIKANGIAIFYGYIGDWNLSYDVSGQSIASVTGFDGFLYLSNQTLPNFVNTVNKSGIRISALVSYLGVTWPGGSTNINPGLISLQADTITEGTNSLDYFQLCERSERGYLFMSANNVLTYYNYGTTGSPKPTVSTINFTDTGSFGYQNIDVVYGSELLYNYISLTKKGATVPITASNASSISLYGQSTYEDTGLLINSDADVAGEATFLAAKFGVPEYRFDSISVMLNPLSGADQNSVLSLELADVVQVTFTPNKIGSPISRYVRIIGINHSMNVDQHNIVFRFAEMTNEPLILDDNTFGLLDSNLLGI